MCQTIIFDLGGVLLDLDPSKSFDALSELLELDIPYENIPKFLESTFLDFELGKLKKENFIWNLQKASKKTPNARQIIDAWNEMLLGFKPERLEMLLELKEQYNVLLLSNTNAIHLDWIYRRLKRDFGITNWDDKYFHKTYYSHQINLRKPNIDIYKYVIQDARIDPSQTIFIDDSEENILASKEAGLKGILHLRNSEIRDKMENYLDVLSI